MSSMSPALCSGSNLKTFFCWKDTVPLSLNATATFSHVWLRTGMKMQCQLVPGAKEKRGQGLRT